eukprot:7120681-Prymnesium_polylepis.2
MVPSCGPVRVNERGERMPQSGRHGMLQYIVWVGRTSADEALPCGWLCAYCVVFHVPYCVRVPPGRGAGRAGAGGHGPGGGGGQLCNALAQRLLRGGLRTPDAKRCSISLG